MFNSLFSARMLATTFRGFTATGFDMGIYRLGLGFGRGVGFTFNQIRNYKVKASLKKRCQHCFFCRRKGTLRIVCKENPRHKQKQK
jgi:ribosomal protein L36